MYEIFLNEKSEIVETGEILFANLKLMGKIIIILFFSIKEVRVIMIRMVKV